MAESVIEWDIELKVWPPFYADVESGAKPFEIRIDDRGYEVGQILWLREWQPDEPRRGQIFGRYTDRGCFRRITYVLRDAERFGLQSGYCVLGLATPLRQDSY